MADFNSLINLELSLRDAQDRYKRGEDMTLCETPILAESLEILERGLSPDDIKILMRLAMDAGEERIKKKVYDNIINV